MNVYFGEVVSASPLKINVEQKMILGEKQLILSRNVTDFSTMVTVDWTSESSLSTHNHTVKGDNGSGGNIDLNTGSKNLAHTHKITGKKKIIIHNGLAVGDEVILILLFGGSAMDASKPFIQNFGICHFYEKGRQEGTGNIQTSILP